MKHAIRYATLTSPTLITRLARATAAAATLAMIGGGLILSSGTAVIGVAGLAVATATPAHARCLIAGVQRNDISDSDCLEAQRTGCVRSRLTGPEYTSCLAANRNKRPSCILQGQVRDDLSPQDCEEARATGCVRRLLSAPQYQSCLDAQPVRR